MMDDLYAYQPLDAALGEIRLLRIDEAEVGNQIQCTVQHFSVEQTPQYAALSYTWDNPLGKADYNEELGESILLSEHLLSSAKTLPIR
jgi:hypothetical protein